MPVLGGAEASRRFTIKPLVSILQWLSTHPGQLEPTTLPQCRLAPDSRSAGLSPVPLLPVLIHGVVRPIPPRLWGGGGGLLLDRVPVAVFDGGDCKGDFRTGGVVVKPQWFSQRGWLVGGGGLMSGVVQEDLPVTMPRVGADATAPSRLWLLRLALWQLGSIAGLVSVPVRVGLLMWHASGCPGSGLVLGVECAADACH